MLFGPVLGRVRVADNSLRVSRLPATHWHDLHQHESASIPLDSRLYHLQEFDHHPYRIRGSLVVRRVGERNGLVLLRLDGPQLRDCSLGRHPACAAELWTFRDRSFRKSVHAERWLYVDDVQLHLQCCIRPGDEEAYQVDQLQGL